MPEPVEGTLVTPSIRLVRPLGAGGMGSLWIADHLTLKTQVVVKFIAEGLSKDAASLARFSREAAAASQVRSPHVVQMLDHGVSPDGVPFIAMELLDGRDLAAHLASKGKLDRRETAQIVTQAARALVKAHEKGIVHRDIKPENIFLCDLGGGETFVKVLDFGIARNVDTQLAATGTGQMVGTPYYMSPEQMMGSKEIDHRSDLWALGVVTYQLLTGERPFDGDTVGALAIAIHSKPLPVPRASNPALPASVDAWFAKACARTPAERFQTARELASALCTALGVTADGAVSSADASGSTSAVRVDAERTATPGSLDRTAVAGTGRIPIDTGVAASVGISGKTSTKSKRGVIVAGAIAAACIVVGVIVLMTTGKNDGATTHAAQASATTIVTNGAPPASAKPTIDPVPPTTAATIAPTTSASTSAAIAPTTSSTAKTTTKTTTPKPLPSTKPPTKPNKPDGYDDIQ